MNRTRIKFFYQPQNFKLIKKNDYGELWTISVEPTDWFDHLAWAHGVLMTWMFSRKLAILGYFLRN